MIRGRDELGPASDEARLADPDVPLDQLGWRNQVGAVIGLLAWDFVVNGLLFGLAASVGRFMPTTAADALMGLKTKHLLPPAAGGAVLVGKTLTLALAGLALTKRRDVP